MESRIWFSHKEDRYDAELKENQKVFHWATTSETWDWDNCVISAVKISESTLRVIVRSSQFLRRKHFRKRKLRYMLGFDFSGTISEPKEDDYPEPPAENVKNKVYGPTRKRWVIELGNSHWIWQWKDEGVSIVNSEVHKIYQMLKEVSNEPYTKSNIFSVVTKDVDEIIPVIYQPAIDSWKNYVEEIHCHRQSNEIEVSIVFRNETLRKFWFLNKIYELFRIFYYRRIKDIETFHIMLENDTPVAFRFKGIYSKEDNIENDTTHYNPPKESIPIKYYFSNEKHPVVFINTSNHAMAEHDNNHRLWKWEYLAWAEDNPIRYGHRPRRQLGQPKKSLHDHNF